MVCVKRIRGPDSEKTSSAPLAVCPEENHFFLLHFHASFAIVFLFLTARLWLSGGEGLYISEEQRFSFCFLVPPAGSGGQGCKQEGLCLLSTS
jgi:hypothetical protein